ncbi:MAG: outer membrane protein assembly factor BamE [Gammaproteobacteria bacterium]|nr:outer membrane protein assembly factor BamE [Gammaproteobacteria bacterium]
MMPPHNGKWKFYPMRIVLLSVFVAALSACGFIGFPGVYKIDVEQGNIVTNEALDQLKPGMSRRQVRFILGTPLVEDAFNQNRWDYPYVKRNGQDILEQSSLTVVFEGDSLVEVRGDNLPPAWGGTPREPDVEADAADDANE